MLDSLLNFGVHIIVLIVQVVELNQRDSGPCDNQIKLIQKSHGLVNQEKELVFVIDALKVLNGAGKELLLSSEQILVHALKEVRQRWEDRSLNLELILAIKRVKNVSSGLIVLFLLLLTALSAGKSGIIWIVSLLQLFHEIIGLYHTEKLSDTTVDSDPLVASQELSTS